MNDHIIYLIILIIIGGLSLYAMINEHAIMMLYILGVGLMYTTTIICMKLEDIQNEE